MELVEEWENRWAYTDATLVRYVLLLVRPSKRISIQARGVIRYRGQRSVASRWID